MILVHIALGIVIGSFIPSVGRKIKSALSAEATKAEAAVEKKG